MCLHLTLTVCNIFPSGEKIMETLHSQKILNGSEDPVVNATYFLQIREMISAISPAYKNLGVGADAVVSLAQASLIMLLRLRHILCEADEAHPTCCSFQNEIWKFSASVRKFSVL